MLKPRQKEEEVIIVKKPPVVPEVEVTQPKEVVNEPLPVTVIDGPVGKVLEFIESLPEGYIVTNILKAPSTLRKNGPIVSLAFVEKNVDYKTVIVHSEDFNEAASHANKAIKSGAEILHAFSSPVSSRKRGRVAFEIIIIMKKKR